MDEADRIIAELKLAPHPEGGWFRETWRAVADDGGRSPGTAIYFLLRAGERSHWHCVDADELWLWHAGSRIDLRVADKELRGVETFMLGGDVTRGYRPQHLVPANRWQAAMATDGWALVSCIVVPGFDYAGFELAPRHWTPGR